MKVVVDIDEVTYKDIKNGKIYTSVRDVCQESVAAIAKGIPLPEGCGRIVDIDKLIDDKCNECGHLKGVSCTIPCYEVRRMLSAPTIIEAVKRRK